MTNKEKEEISFEEFVLKGVEEHIEELNKSVEEQLTNWNKSKE